MPGLELAELDHEGSESGGMHESAERGKVIPRVASRSEILGQQGRERFQKTARVGQGNNRSFASEDQQSTPDCRLAYCSQSSMDEDVESPSVLPRHWLFSNTGGCHGDQQGRVQAEGGGIVAIWLT